MINSIILHDSRLEGTIRVDDERRVYRVGPSASVPTLARHVWAGTQENGGNPVPVLSIAAHGTTHPEPGHRVAGPQGSYDFVIQLGETLHPDNAAQFGRLINGRISDRIRLLVCSPVRYRDGIRTCGALAVSAGVPVYASSMVQDYDHDRLFGIGQPMNFGAWEGMVYRFSERDGSYTHCFTGPDSTTFD
ncbi:hypothetical protein [Yoonia sp. SS1-5]|uniref:Uncharacterized protein n=1 Tax=Yoonia rhodophyticola TaxID=3137370 RepID=A0AAN0NJR8_9RHOB